MRPFREVLSRAPNSSWSMLNRRLDERIPFQWHHHPEFELTLTLNSIGQRFIGDHTGDYGHEDLVLVGPNLPHTWASRGKIRDEEPHVALVLWFHPDWMRQMISGAVEFRPVVTMLERARAGLTFSPETARHVRAQFEAIFLLPPATRLLSLLGILEHIAADREQRPLATSFARTMAASESRERIDRVLAHIHQRYASDMTLVELADIAALSVSGLHRMFRRHTGATISAYLMQMRIGDACARLSSTNLPIRHVAEAAGYNSLANFNRQFKALKGLKPSSYRAMFR